VINDYEDNNDEQGQSEDNHETIDQSDSSTVDLLSDLVLENKQGTTNVLGSKIKSKITDYLNFDDKND